MNSPQALIIKPVQLNLHADLCVSFREDSFVVSFGDAKKFYEEDGKGAERYIQWLQSKIEKDPKSVVHVWQSNQIIGQIELGLVRSDPSCGYVNLYYLIPSMRGQGFGVFLDRYVMEYFKNLGRSKAKLSVSPTNISANSYYRKMGWIDLGPRENHPEVHLMEKNI